MPVRRRSEIKTWPAYSSIAPTLNSAVGGTVAMVGEGFLPGETVTISGCIDEAVPANADGAAAIFCYLPATAGVSQCILTGGTSGRVARGNILLHPNVANQRGLISAPHL